MGLVQFCDIVRLWSCINLAVKFFVSTRRYRGENLSEAQVSKAKAGPQRLRWGGNIPGISTPVTAGVRKRSSYPVPQRPHLN